MTALREEGYKVKIITKTHSSVQNFGMQAETADHWARSTVRNGYCNIDWLERCQLLHDLTDGWHHELTENMRSDPGIFDFLTWLRVDEPREQSLAEALQAARERFPRQGEPDVSLGINARDNRRLAPPEAVTIEYPGTGPTTTNMPQTMRVWPGLKLIGPAAASPRASTCTWPKWAPRRPCWTAATPSPTPPS